MDDALNLATRQGWTAFVPWPESLRAGVDLAQGDLDRAQDRLDHAFALSCQVGDPCWEGISERGLSLLCVARGDVGEAVTTLRDARARCTRLPDAYVWLDGYTLDGLCAVAVEHQLDEAAHWPTS